MATRATYTINGDKFYCHWDGYAEGAATRFAKMLNVMFRKTDFSKIDYFDSDQRGPLSFAFIRGNYDAQPWDGGDWGQEYNWNLTTNVIGEMFVNGIEIHEFINKHNDLVKSIYVKVEYGNGVNNNICYVSKDRLQEIVAFYEKFINKPEIYKELRDYMEIRRDCFKICCN